MSDLVLVTGGTGYLGAHVVKAALDAGYRVRTTVRSLARADGLRAAVGARSDTPLEFALADLQSDDGWGEAVAGVDYVLHVASPYPAGQPRDENELIAPAREGTLRVLRAALAAGVKRVVITSSFAAIGYGHGDHPEPYTEEDWTDVAAPGVTAYQKSKTLAERAAWEFAAEHPELEVVSVNPVGIFGPPLGAADGTSVFILRTVQRSPIVPDMKFGVVDVRDVAALELAAMTSADAAGERFLAVSGFTGMKHVAGVLGKRPLLLPDWVVRAAAPFAPMARSLANEIGVEKRGSSAHAGELLGWRPRPLDETIRDMGAALVAAREGQP
ncbi:SDR family oxidoreductase [Gryllotalpicola protaetiae]|uniref:Aldehyde reductase n=1 Tax=Gryllotalpicola protaetiae TaxID=2419771 RepID=A0A387BLF2_9MICO|nr:aldehyde reductase [Gryllotalpicola protaetiae]AYG03488.1 aldehyde reductase [Gryllotalpicola protaetiae]